MSNQIPFWLVRVYLWACQRLYAELAWSYDSVSWLVSFGRWSTWRRAALGYLPTIETAVSPSLQILEIGFGTGELLIEMTQRGLQCYGLEYSLAMQQVVTKKSRHRQLYLARVCGQAQRLPFASATFDAVIATFPANYILDPATLAEVRRVLRHPGGRLIIVGLWVSVNQPWLAALLPVFYGQPTDAALRRYQAQLGLAGLQTTFHTYQDGLFSVGVIIAEAITNPIK